MTTPAEEEKRRYEWKGKYENGEHIHQIKCPHCRNIFNYECDEQFPKIEFREWIRDKVSNYGVVVEDFDLILRVYDKNGRDSKGSFKLCELKLREKGHLKFGQKMTFGLINELLLTSPEQSRYEGFYIIEVSTYNWITEAAICKWWINNREVTSEEFIRFCHGYKIDGIEPIRKINDW